MSRPLTRLLSLVLVAGLPCVPALAKPVPTLDEREVTVAPAPAHQVLVAKGTFGLRGGSATRLERTLDLASFPDHQAFLMPLAVSARGQAVEIEVESDAQGMRSSSFSSRQLTGHEGPVRAASSAPLLYLWSGTALTADVVILGPPTSQSEVRSPAGGAESTAWTEVEDPVFHALFAPADLELAAVLTEIPGRWVKAQEKSRERRVPRPDGLPPWTQKTSVHYLGVTQERALYEFEVATAGPIFTGERRPWTLTRTATGSVLVTQDGKLFHGHVELTAAVTANEEELRVAVSKVNVTPLEGDAPQAGAAQQVAEMIRLRREDEDAFQDRLLDETAATARRLVAEIRDATSLDDVTVELWDDTVDLGAIVREARQLADSPLALDVLEAHGPTLVTLGILDASTVEEMRKLVPGGSGGLPWAIAFAVPSKKLVLVRPDAVSDIGILAHEYAHVISDARGYVDKARVGLDSKEALDLAFVDVDGAISAWALEEAQAEVTEEAVKRQIGNPVGFGFALKTYAASVRAPEAELTLFDHLLHLLYRTSPKVIAAAHESGDTVEKTVARAFETYSYQTRQILFPREKTEASLLFPRALALRGDGGPTGATRVGAFGLQQALFRRHGMAYRAATNLVKDLRDDVVLRYPEGHLWVSRWTDAAAAERFAGSCPPPPGAEGGTMRVQEDAVVVVFGTVPDAGAVVTGLLEAVR